MIVTTTTNISTVTLQTNNSSTIPNTTVSSTISTFTTTNDGVNVNYLTQNATPATQIPLLHLPSTPATALSPSLLPQIAYENNNVTSSQIIGQSPTPVITTPIATSSNILKYNQTVPHGYLIYGPHCKIPDLDPMGEDVMKLFHPKKFT